ncbi:hypothetical protein PSTT_16573 [Puccinia striiformis]|uniref:Uncharacterized protein n=1 Tax=Puccinia striiformis TaxID=27350 RepID=A0A2S4UCG2_9BASI|nr:hypothetical protein PSTT_16573 [Puccinia striiformis]
MFKVNQLVAIQISQKAWESSSASTITNCWGATKIIKECAADCLDVVKKAIKESRMILESQLNTLESSGAVLPHKRMSITNLLNPEGEDNQSLQM